MFRQISLLILSLLLSCPILAQEKSRNCTGPYHVKTETKICKYDITYPKLGNVQVECEVRKWIDSQKAEFDEGLDLDEYVKQKNEFWITCDVFDSGDTQSVLVSNYEYAQGAHGSTEIKTYVFDKKTGEQYVIYDVIDDKKDWMKAIYPFILEKDDKDDMSLIIPETENNIFRFKNFVLDHNDLIICFDEESVGPHSYGIVDLTIPLSKIKKVLKKKFQPTN